MRGVYLPGDRRVEVREVPDPTPGERQLVVRMRASTICGRDLRAIYREHLGRGPEAYRDGTAGDDPGGGGRGPSASCSPGTKPWGRPSTLGPVAGVSRSVTACSSTTSAAAACA